MGSSLMMLKNIIFTLLLLISSSAAKHYLVETEGHHKPCLGCPKLSEMKQEIVNFVLQKLEDPMGRCSVIVKEIQNFKKQVVAGNLYTFNLVLKHKAENPDSTFYCEFEDGEEEACHMEVLDVPWKQ